MIHGHGGNIYALAAKLKCAPTDIVDMSSNINPMGMPPGLLEELHTHLDRAGLLPEVDSRSVIESMADVLDVDPGRMLAGNGTTQFIYTICPALASARVLIVGPTYADYADACRMYGIEADHFLLDPAGRFQLDWEELSRHVHSYDTVFVCNPNNPTAGLFSVDRLQDLCRRHGQTRFVIDESYLPFVPEQQAASMAGCGLDNVIVLWSASKIFGIPGLRAGFLIASGPIRRRFQMFGRPWSVNSLAQVAITYLGRNRAQTRTFIGQTRHFLEKERLLFRQRLEPCRDLTLYPSVSSYYLMQLPPSMNAGMVCHALSRRRMLIRDCSNIYGLSDRFVRVALKSSAVNAWAVDQLMEVFPQFDPS